jgi:iron complex transport system substrate-binding protein
VRIASLTCSNTEIVAALGFADCLVAVDDHSDFPAEALEHLPRLGKDLQIDLEKLRRSRPDLVLASLSVPGMERVVEGVMRLGIETLVLDPVSWSDVLEDILLVADRLGVAAVGQRVTQNLEAELVALRAGLPEFSRPPRVLIEWWPKPVIVAAQDSWVNDLLASLGAQNAFAHLERRSCAVRADQVLEVAPDVIAVSWCGAKRLRPEVVLNRSGWADVPAIRYGRVHAVPESGLGRPGPRLLEGATALAQAIRGCL